jgi:hypothetical protein
MRDGYDGDDIYIMVEDEFQAIAQSYTAHLHRAEYKKLMRESKQRPAKALPEPTSPMTSDARKRLKAAALREKQKGTLQQVTGIELIDEEDEEDKIGDLWSGTSLGPLMADGSQPKTSLVGLERLNSTTRAGMGFARSRSKDGLVEPDDVKSHGCVPEAQQVRSQERGSSSTTSDRSSTLHREASRPSRPGLPKSVMKERLMGQKDLPVASGNNASGVIQARSKTNLPHDQTGHGRPHTIGNRFLKRKKDEEKDKKDRLDEVPMFIL